MVYSATGELGWFPRLARLLVGQPLQLPCRRNLLWRLSWGSCSFCSSKSTGHLRCIWRPSRLAGEPWVLPLKEIPWLPNFWRELDAYAVLESCGRRPGTFDWSWGRWLGLCTSRSVRRTSNFCRSRPCSFWQCAQQNGLGSSMRSRWRRSAFLGSRRTLECVCGPTRSSFRRCWVHGLSTRSSTWMP